MSIDIIVLPGRGLETAANTDSIRRFLSALIATVASMVTVVLGPLSYQWTELSLYKGQEQPDL